MRQILFSTVLFLLSNIAFSADEFIHFNTNNEKLNHNTVNAIFHDKLGYVWVATNNGLNKLDAYQTTIYQHIKNDSTTVSANFINTVFVDSDNDLWIGNLGGDVKVFERKKNEFVSLSQNTEHFNIKNITAFSQDKLGNIWIGTEGNGVYKYNKTNGEIKNFDLEKHDPAKRTNSNVNVIFCDNEGDIWIGMTKAEVFMIDPRTDQISYYGLLREQAGFKQVGSIMGIGQLADSTVLFATWNGNLYEFNKQHHTQIQLRHSPAFFNNASLTDLTIDNDNNIWLGTWENGLFKLCPSTSQLSNFIHNANKPGSIVSNAINSLHIDKQKNKLWIGTTNNGLSVLSLQTKMFSTLNPDISAENAINVYSIIKDQNENLWIGTRGNGLWMVNPTTGETRNYLSEQHNGLNSNAILTLKMDTDGKIWIGTDGSFVCFFDPKSQSFTQVPFGTDWSQAVFAIEESPNYIWAGTWGGGIKKIDKKTLQYTSINFDANDQYRNTVFDLAMHDSVLWIADIGIGLIRYNTVNNTTKKYSQTEGCKNCPSERILDIFVQSDTLLYLGTDGDGLHAFNIFTETFRRIDYQQNETSNVVQAIVTDNNENLWIASTFGLTCMDKQHNTFHYFKHNGLSNNQLNKGALLFDWDSTILFAGTTEGINYANTDHIILDSKPSPPIFTKLFISNRIIEKPNKRNLQQTIDVASEIVVYPNEKTITIHFSSMDFTPTFRNSYLYQLSGFDDNWIENDHEVNFVQYTNLNPGEYILKVKSKNSDGIVSDAESEIKIIIKPAFWQTLFFKILIALAGIWLILLFYQIRNRNLIKAKLNLEEKVKQRTREIEMQKEHIEQQKRDLEIANETKKKFLSIISHDLKNPILNIDDLTSLIIKFHKSPNNEPIDEFLCALKSASSNTLNLLDNLLIWARTQTDKIEIKPETIEANEIIKATLTICKPLANRKNINIISPQQNTFKIIVDRNTIETVLRNIITNAIKYSEPNSSINIELQRTNNEIVFCISDKGIGMSEEIQNSLFRIDKVISKTGTQDETGTGMGLIICKEFIQLNGGKIWVESIENEGSTFNFSVPGAKSSN